MFHDSLNYYWASFVIRCVYVLQELVWALKEYLVRLHTIHLLNAQANILIARGT